MRWIGLLPFFVCACTKQPSLFDSSTTETYSLDATRSSRSFLSTDEGGTMAKAPASVVADAASAERLDLPGFYGALESLDTKARPDSVRVAWFGDSHTAADFLTGEVRHALQQRFGNGGPGFVHVGLSHTRPSHRNSRNSANRRASAGSPSRST